LTFAADLGKGGCSGDVRVGQSRAV
jgi:hypothetical protein